ncbi:phage holin [Staphylococcus felis]|uniref:phage holin n=3 Tax=Staphylococcus felis TaxID=46127 RepID=UPI00248061B0|nr:phage holin [Staphylococcus felis]
MEINWKLRFKNKTILSGLVGAVLLFIKQVTELFGLDISTQLEQVSGLIGIVLTLLAGLGIIVDPTTNGIKDSGIAQTYVKPRDSKKEGQQVAWQNENNSFHVPLYTDELAEEVEYNEGLRDIDDDIRIVNNYDSDINNSGVMLDTSNEVEGVIEDGQNATSNQ